MYAIYKRELLSFLNSMVAYSVIGVFLLATGILLWFFPETSILDYGYAELTGFFTLAPFLFMFLIPAICMRSFAEERKEGTFILLAIRPVAIWEIVLAKYLACFTIVVFALAPTLVYYYSVYQLGLTKGNIDSGAVIGSYIGLLLLSAAFASIGILASALTKNQVIAFVTGVFICFIAYTGFESAAEVSVFQAIASQLGAIGINAHYQAISRGVLDTRDLIYFVTVIAVFLGLTHLAIGGRKW